MVEYLENGLGAARAGSDGRTLRWRVGETGCSGYVELVETPDEPPGTQRLAEGSVHHCAWDVVDKRRSHLCGRRTDATCGRMHDPLLGGQ